MSEPRFESALAGQAAPLNLSITVTEVVDRGMIDLRGDPQDLAFSAAVESGLGVSLPRQPRTSVVAGDLSVLWLSVDQWLVQCPRTQVDDFVRKLKQALNGIPSLVVDLSDARTILRMQGERVREVIMKGAPVDLTAPAFNSATVRRLRFGEVAAMVHMVAESPDVIDLFVFRSYAVFVSEWLIATSLEAAQVGLFEPQPPPIA